jgi:hypothetical protein
MLLLRMKLDTVFEHSLSMTLMLIGMLLICNASNMLWNAVIMAASVLVGIGRAIIALMS